MNATTLPTVAALYLAIGVLVSWSIKTNRAGLLDLVMKIGRFVPGFEENFVRGASMFGFGPNANVLAVLWTAFTWPLAVMALAIMVFTARKFDRHQRDLHSARGAPLVPGGIYGAAIAIGSMRETIITEHCEQVREVFKPITMEERVWFGDFWAKVFSPNVFGKDGNASIGEVESLELSLGGAKGPSDTLEPGMAHARLFLKPLRVDGPKEISIMLSFEREVWVGSSCHGLQEIKPYVIMQIGLRRDGEPQTVEGIPVVSAGGMLEVEWRQGPPWSDDDIKQHWSNEITREELNSLPIADDASEGEVTAWLRASSGNEQSVAFAIVHAMATVLNDWDRQAPTVDN